MEGFRCVILQTTQHRIAHARLSCTFASGHHTPRDVAVGDQANWFQVLDAFDDSNLPAIMPHHYLGCLPHRVFRRAASNIRDHNVFASHESLDVVNPNIVSYLEH